MHQSESDVSFAVLSVFTSAPEHRQQFVALVEDFVSAQFRTQPGLRSFEMFTDESREQIVTLARWKDRAAFEQFKHSEAGLEASEVARVLTPKVFFLRPEATLTGAVGAVQIAR